MTRLFTVAEANALIPHLRNLLEKALRVRARLVEMIPDVSGAKEGHVFDWGTPAGPEYLRVLERFGRISSEIQEMGVMVKDLDKGLCDFPHQRDGRIVYLCWKQDEDEIGWWHDVDAGFDGRRPL